MKRLFALILLAAIAYGGYQYYQHYASVARRSSLVVAPKLDISTPAIDLPDFNNVLGAATSLLNKATDGQAEPLINKTLNNLQQEVKDLPREQYQKVKYEFCQDVIREYESN